MRLSSDEIHRGGEVDCLCEEVEEKKLYWKAGTIAVINKSTGDLLIHVSGQKPR